MITQTETTTIKNGSIALPKQFQKAWKKARVFLDVSGDTIFIKRLSRPSLTLSEMAKEFQRAARKTKLSEKDVERAIKDVRKKMYNEL